jgi:hypothetical protein
VFIKFDSFKIKPISNKSDVSVEIHTLLNLKTMDKQENTVGSSSNDKSSSKFAAQAAEKVFFVNSMTLQQQF